MIPTSPEAVEAIIEGLTFAKARRYKKARESFLRAVEIAQAAGDRRTADRATGHLNRIAKLSSLTDARARTFVRGVAKGNDSMLAAGLRPGRYYRFRTTRNWQDGDIAAVITPAGKCYICYLYHAPQNRVTLVFDEDYESECHDRAALTVEGVLDV